MVAESAIAWQIEQLVKARLFPDENAVMRSALRALFEDRPELKRKMVVSAYEAGDISLGKAAQLMGVPSEEMKDIIRESGGLLHLGPKTVDELLEDIANA